MKILVCVKAIAESRTSESSKDVRMNRFDEFALEQALIICQSRKESRVDVISAGTDKAAPILTRAMGMGADHGIHILMPEIPFPDPFFTASLIAEYAKNKEYDLILTGIMSEDLMQAQTGGMIAEILSIPCTASVISAQVSKEKIFIEREIGTGTRESWELCLPALLTVQTGLNKPRYPSLSRMLWAARQEIEIIKAKTLNPPAVLQIVTGTAMPEKQRSGIVLKGSLEQKAVKLMQLFKDKGFL